MRKAGAAIIGIMLGWHGARAAMPGGACNHLGIAPGDRVPGQVFPVILPPYGSVCFVGHRIADPLAWPPAKRVHGPSGPYIALSLYRHGQDVHDFTYPNTPGELWNTGIDNLVSVAFRRLPGSPTIDVIVIGQGAGAGGARIYQPLVFMGTPTGFSLNYNLSLTLFEQGNFSTMTSLLRAIDKIGTAMPAPKQ